VIHGMDVDPRKSRPDGQDREEDQTLSE
jgi:hypothetical protein